MASVRFELGETHPTTPVVAPRPAPRCPSVSRWRRPPRPPLVALARRRAARCVPFRAPGPSLPTALVEVPFLPEGASASHLDLLVVSVGLDLHRGQRATGHTRVNELARIVPDRVIAHGEPRNVGIDWLSETASYTVAQPFSARMVSSAGYTAESPTYCGIAGIPIGEVGIVCTTVLADEDSDGTERRQPVCTNNPTVRLQ